ncbi:hypothetical protein AB6A40_010565 [Gnathostoma spinigerum]|uniref:7TM GPCR serpentine receptor class x (Srx) domain-containing protein n=1 Tax=Gnathostoma spinigerum TaxID=75299 RepID=A0ABD6EVE3_9BILA
MNTSADILMVYGQSVFTTVVVFICFALNLLTVHRFRKVVHLSGAHQARWSSSEGRMIIQIFVVCAIEFVIVCYWRSLLFVSNSHDVKFNFFFNLTWLIWVGKNPYIYLMFNE